ncbi:MAG: shikimate kinase [Spirochaetia bacterium]|nr:shikimate kinase [Spirochaetia bacterium]
MISTKSKVFFLTGIKHSGKSSVGRAVARLLGAHFIDIDDLIVDILPIGYDSIRSFYKEEGKEAFMSLELKCVEEYLLSVHPHIVYIIALGGGACDNIPLTTMLKERGVILYLSLLEETLLQRIKEKGVPPFLDKDDLEGSFHSLFSQRDGQYRQLSDFVVSLRDFESIESNAKKVASFITQLLGDTTWAEIPLEVH